ncbi:hypothetical protein, partial [Citricoccus sp.]|uniref:hypothetical protein n=1 Tax=Citricoccus sp. TaxID=1978372 RepID=UPI0028BF2872
MVDVPDRGIAVRGAADPVTEKHHVPQQAGEGATVRVHRDELTGARCGVEATDEDLGLGVRDHPAGHGCRDRTLTGQPGGEVDVFHAGARFGACIWVLPDCSADNAGGGEEAGVGHDQLDLDGDGVGGGLAGESLDEEVGEDLLRGPLGGVAFGDGAGCGHGQILEARGALGDREQCGEVG